MEATQDILIYEAANGQTQLEVQLQNETVWLTQAQMAELFGREQSVITKHIRSIFKSEELDEETSVQKMYRSPRPGESTAGNPSKRKAEDGRPADYYNLDVIIAVGYRVNSKQGTQFRQWATRTLREYLVQGFVLNEQRLREDQRQLTELKRLLQLQGEILESQELTPVQSTALLRVLSDYARALDVLTFTPPPGPLPSGRGEPQRQRMLSFKR